MSIAKAQSFSNENQIIDNGGVPYDQFGFSVSIDDNRLAVGAPRVSANGYSQQGAVFIYEYNGTTWVQQAEINPVTNSMAAESFGYSVSLQGDRLVVGAVSATVNGGFNHGAAYVFDYNGSTWVETQKLTHNGGVTGDQFGQAVSLYGDRIAVSASGVTVGGNSNQGAIYVFDLDNNGAWIQYATPLTVTGGGINDRLGTSLSLHSDRLLAGAPAVNGRRGAVYIFELNGGSWSHLPALIRVGGQVEERFGEAVYLNASRFAVSAPGMDNGSTTKRGAAYVLDRDSNGAWTWSVKLTSADSNNDVLGQALDLDGDRLAISSRRGGVAGGRSAVYIYDFDGTVWVENQRITASNDADGSLFGHDVSLDGNYLAIGAYNVGNGLAYVYNPETVGVTVNGLSGSSGSLVLQNNGGDDLSVSRDGFFSFSSTLVNGNPYSVTILSVPAGLTCSVDDASGTVNGSVNNIVVNCFVFTDGFEGG